MPSLFYLILLAKLTRLRYSANIPEKKGNRRGNLNYIKAHKPRNAAFLRVFTVACLLWAAIAGAFGLLVSFGVPVSNLLFAALPSWKKGGGLTTHQRGRS